MDIPDLVEGALDGEEIQAGVSLGDEDAVCLTPTRTLVYRGEGLLSDEAVEEYSHDIEQLAVSEGRRKTKFTMQYIDGTESFTVPANRGEKVLELFLEGVLKLDGVIEARESLAGVYRFSELTLIIAEGRLIKHIGSQVWSEDYEVYAYDDVTGLEFERASVATSIALSVDGRPQRIKVPNDKAPVVRQTLEGALFNYYDVTNVEELNRVVGGEDADAGGVDAAADESGDGFSFGDDFDPLVSDEADLAESVDADERLAEGDAQATDRQPRDTDRQPGGGSAEPAADRSADASTGSAAEPATRGSEAATGGASEPARSNADQASDARNDRASNAGNDRDSNVNAGNASGANRERSGGDSPDRPETGAESAGSEPESPSASAEPADSGGDAVDERRTGSDAGEADTADASGADAQQPNSPKTAPQRANSREADATEPADTSPSAAGSAQPENGSADPAAAGDAGADPADTSTSRSSASSETAGDTDGAEPAPVTREEFEAMAERLDELTEAVDRQNELLKRQHRALKQLVQQNSE
ncbi:DUF7115 domain-containing protein [Halosimplex marinum]|uniref:DUF7115 domain-containing protein n=1 Tax=Halosimplex marinum TaxID=3396620 RepID=UPI003F578DD5